MANCWCRLTPKRNRGKASVLIRTLTLIADAGQNENLANQPARPLRPQTFLHWLSGGGREPTRADFERRRQSGALPKTRV